MLVIAVVILIEQAFRSTGLIESAAALELLSRLYGVLAVFANPFVVLASLLAPPLIALKRNRSFWQWLLCGLAFGPFAFVVLAIPRAPEPDLHPGETPHDCPHCEAPYFLSDYLPDASLLGCSRCGEKFARPDAA